MPRQPFRAPACRSLRRIFGVRDLPADHEVIRPVADRLGWRGYALLIALLTPCRAYTVRDKQRARYQESGALQPLPKSRAQLRPR